MAAPLPSCPHCGRPIPADAPLTLCPNCLVDDVLRHDESWAPKPAQAPADSSPLAPTPPGGSLPAGVPTRLGNCELIGKIAHGGMGVVYKARHAGLDRLVAVKMIRSGVLADRGEVERFQREARSVARLRHPNIVTIHDIGEQDGQHYYTMDYVPGQNLAGQTRAGPLLPRQAAEITAKVAEAIHYAHGRGVLHRDIKPANVIVTPDQQPHVLDFGLASIVTDESTLTQSGWPMGSPPYMPPEQAAGQIHRIDARSDVYSLGAMLYELLTGRPPFQAASTLETLQLVREGEAVPPRRLNPALPADLETVCLKSLAKAPERRYQTALEVAEELERFLRGEPIRAHPATSVEKAWRWCRRNPMLAGLSATTAVLLLSVAIGSPIALYRIDEQRHRVDLARQEARRRAYAAEMGAASRALDRNQPAPAIELLNRQRPKAEEDDLRGLDWRYLWSQLRTDDWVTLRGHRGGVREVAFSSDGRLLASASLDHTVRVWEVASGRPVRELPGPTDQNIHQSVAFAPGGDVLAVAARGRLFLWRTSDWQMITPPDESASPPVAFTPDGKTLVHRSKGGLTLRDTITWQGVSLDTTSSRGIRGCLAIAPDNRLLAYGFAQGAPLQFWDIGAHAKVGEIEILTSCLTFFSGGHQLAVGDWLTNQLRVLDMISREFAGAYATGAQTVFSAVYSLDEKVMATPVGAQIYLYDTATGEKRTVLKGHENEIQALAHSPVAPLLASGSLDGTVRLWRDPPLERANRAGAPSDLDFLSLSSGRAQLYSGPTNGPLQFWDLTQGRLATTLTISDHAPLRLHFTWKTQISPDGRYAACGTTNGLAHVFECATGDLLTTLETGGDITRAGAFSPDNRWLLTAEEGRPDLLPNRRGGGGLLWNWQTRQVEARFPDAFCLPTKLPVGTFSPDGRLLAYISQFYQVNLWDTASKRVVRALPGHGWVICALRFSPDGRLIATSSYDNTTRVWDVASGRSVTPPLNGQSRALWFTRDSRLLVASDTENVVRFWDLPTGYETLTIENTIAAWLPSDERSILLWRPEGVALADIPTMAEIRALEASPPRSNRDQ